MKIRNVILHVIRALAYLAFASLLLVAGFIGVLYSPWAQNLAREAIVNKLDGRDGKPKLSLDRLRLQFPLTLEGSGISLEQNGDTIMAAGQLNLSVELLPLLSDKVCVSELELQKALYVMGTPDSLMYMRIKADSLGLSSVLINLPEMGIELPDGSISGGKIAMVMRPDTGAPTPCQR